jgi:2-polyprenyl-6-methoxyphenol hydroxylase-like FAD-dependent oxidoreductase
MYLDRHAFSPRADREPAVLTTSVLIVGAGPVGLTLAVDLGKRGIPCVLIEQKDAPQFLPKMERCNARTMEMFRRLGLADKIRAAGLPSHVPMDVFIVLAMNEPPLNSQHYPSVDEARAEIRTSNDGTQPLEPYQLISQYTLEPLLKSVAEGLPSVTVRYGCEFQKFAQDETGVTAQARNADGSSEVIRATYMVGCDGGASPVRKQLGIPLRGEGNLLELRQALYRCDELFDRIPIGPGPGKGRHYHVADDRATFLIMQDSTVHWTLHSVVDSDAEMKTMFERTIGIPMRYEMLSCAPWRQNLLLADRYGEGRVFLAGDAAHLVIPTGGLGMNTGVGDAIDLAWKLAATLQGFGGPNLLRSYEIERRQVGERNVGASRYASLGRRKWRSQYRPGIRDDSAAGQAIRDALVQVAQIEQPKSNEMIGAELGYRYVDSPVICNVPGGPEHLFREYHPTTWPGARLPHVWLGDGTPIQDRIPDGYTVLRLGGTRAETSALEAAIKNYGARVSTLDIPDTAARDICGYDLLLLRPDMHVVWRGNRLPDDIGYVAATATGHEGWR